MLELWTCYQYAFTTTLLGTVIHFPPHTIFYMVFCCNAIGLVRNLLVVHLSYSIKWCLRHFLLSSFICIQMTLHQFFSPSLNVFLADRRLWGTSIPNHDSGSEQVSCVGVFLSSMRMSMSSTLVFSIAASLAPTFLCLSCVPWTELVSSSRGSVVNLADLIVSVWSWTFIPLSSVCLHIVHNTLLIATVMTQFFW